MFTHIKNDHPSMVNVGEKIATQRTATARSIIQVPKEIADVLVETNYTTKKGPVFHTAILAGTMAVKKTWDLIPLCHPIPIDGCDIVIEMNDKKQIVIDCSVQAYHKTGVEMEALCGATIAALAIYDMCKAISHDMKIIETTLLEKKGGKSDVSK